MSAAEIPMGDRGPAWPVKVRVGRSLRTFQKVRRDSRLAEGLNEPQRYISARQGHAMKAAIARQLAAEKPPPGRRHGWEDGKLSVWAPAIYGYLVDFAVATGRIFPSYERIAAAVGCSRRTVARVLRCLADLRLIDWDRRCELTPAQGEKGPQVHQASNFYALLPYNAAKQLLERWRRRRRGDDADQAERDAKEATRRQYEEIAARMEQQAALDDWEAKSPAMAAAGRRVDIARQAALDRGERE